MAETFGSTCHGAGRASSRNSARRNLDYQTVHGLARLHLSLCFALHCVSADCPVQLGRGASRGMHAPGDSMGIAGRMRIVGAERQACACRFWTA